MEVKRTPIARHTVSVTAARRCTVRVATAALCALVALVSLMGTATPTVAAPPLRPIDDDLVRARGIRKLTSKHFTLYTDLPRDRQIDELPRVFDLAVPEWCAYFGINPAAQADFHMRGCLIKDVTQRKLFEEVGLMPTEVSAFRNGYSRGRELWLYEQPNTYYRRHLLLHEGTHGFMNSVLGGTGPPWYMEGTGEMFGTHAYENGRLRLGYFPARREEVPMLGRIKLVQTATATSGVKPLRNVLEYDNRAHLENEAYAWCWALTKFLDTHPRYQARFRALPRHVSEPNFTERFMREYAGDWPELVEEWQVFAATLAHGHDIVKTAIDFKAGAPLAGEEARIDVVAERGWQNSGLRLAAGTTYRITAEGRFQVAAKPKIWWCEPGGVTIRYYDGRPLGMLLGVVRPDQRRGRRQPNDDPPAGTPFLSPLEIGLGTTLTPAASGTLYLKINDSPGELGDNAGQVQVRVSAL